MGRRGRLQKFVEHEYQRELDLAGRGVLRWVLINDPSHPAPHAESFRVISVDGTTRALHPTEALDLLIEHDHPDAEYVPTAPHVGQPFTH